MKKKLLILTIFLFIISIESPQGMIFPMWIVIFIFKDKLIKIVDKIALPIAFIWIGTLLWLFTEFFAILNNLNVEYGKRILMSQDPITDILIAPAYYTFFISLIYFLVKKYNFSKKEIFFISGIYWIFTENNWIILLNIFINPLLWTATAFLVMSVYAVFPILTYLLTEHRFENNRQKPTIKIYLLLPIILFLFWAIFWNITLPIFKIIFWE